MVHDNTKHKLFKKGKIENLVYKVEEQLLKHISVKSITPYNPVKVDSIPTPWILLGTGNYAAVLYHPDFEDLVVKIYAEGRSGIQEEIHVYRKLGHHPAYSQCFHHGENYLILKRLKGNTLYDCLRKGITIKEKVIIDVDKALEYAVKQGLHPHDVHVKNVMVIEGRGVIADVSDFLKQGDCSIWEDLKNVYYKVYRKYLYKLAIPIPYIILELIRKGYRLYKTVKRFLAQRKA
ncbi:serine/threonine protein kinase [Clostridium sp. DJ247]|uniref:serine/threonine protein kinase n=1 Tax=Clostridium sp. DJ247 TaxID=2726188 RepID=UPI00162A4A4C|nr:serine/threonine protein kinase [Clostridium sp. DJ247]MBC2582519.1 serine/threonine protein kinase [Clostridium sp. DJ247]